MAGVQIDLIVRGICCLIPGIKGYTENIQVISIVGRYLEHSRIYIFGKGEDCRVYIASADFMTRNTTKRVEVAAPVYDADIKNRILESFQLMLRDNVKASVLNADGNYYQQGLRRNPAECTGILLCGCLPEGGVSEGEFVTPFLSLVRITIFIRCHAMNFF